MGPRYIWCTIVRRLSRQRYLILDETGRIQVKAFEHLKRVSEAVFRNSTAEKQAIKDYLEAVNIDEQRSRRGRKSKDLLQLRAALRKTVPVRRHSVPVREPVDHR